MPNIFVAFFCSFISCAHASGGPVLIGERQLQPPRAGIQVGSLYYVREVPTNDLSTPANLTPLCTVNLSKYGVTPRSGEAVADIDLLSNIEFSGALSGLQTKLFSAGLNGSLSNYFEYKIVNVKKTEIEYVDAEKIFAGRALRNDCLRWQGSIAKQNWGIYQIQAISIGDIQFSRKSEWSGGGDISAKLVAIEPELKASIKRTSGYGFSGKGLVVTFVPILRSAMTQ